MGRAKVIAYGEVETEIREEKEIHHVMAQQQKQRRMSLVSGRLISLTSHPPPHGTPTHGERQMHPHCHPRCFWPKLQPHLRAEELERSAGSPRHRVVPVRSHFICFCSLDARETHCPL